MNLGKLLGAGKSFVSGRNPAAYRADKRVYLPQFVSPKNPFASPPAAPAPATSPKPAPSSAAPLTQVARPWIKTQKMSVLPPAARSPGPARAATWASKFNPANIFRDVTAAPGRLETVVQTELSLEKVKVVHNDLTDADVEIVPMKSRPARPVIPDLQPAKNSWEVLGERIMKATAL